MENPVLEERIEQFRKAAQENRENFIIFSAVPALFWLTVPLGIYVVSIETVCTLLGSFLGLASLIMAVVAASWATGKDLTARQRLAWWGLTVFLVSPTLSWLFDVSIGLR